MGRPLANHSRDSTLWPRLRGTHWERQKAVVINIWSKKPEGVFYTCQAGSMCSPASLQPKGNSVPGRSCSLEHWFSILLVSGSFYRLCRVPKTPPRDSAYMGCIHWCFATLEIKTEKCLKYLVTNSSATNNNEQILNKNSTRFSPSFYGSFATRTCDFWRG